MKVSRFLLPLILTDFVFLIDIGLNLKIGIKNKLQTKGQPCTVIDGSLYVRIVFQDTTTNRKKCNKKSDFTRLENIH